jgi:hypothetical protein
LHAPPCPNGRQNEHTREQPVAIGCIVNISSESLVLTLAVLLSCAETKIIPKTNSAKSAITTIFPVFIFNTSLVRMLALANINLIGK